MDGKVQIDETAFNQAVSYNNNAVSTMTKVTSSASAVLIPSGFSNAGEVRSILKDISSVIQPKVGDFSSAFAGMAESIPLLKQAELDALEDRLVRDENGNIIGIISTEGYISLDGYRKKESETGTVFLYVGGGDSGVKNGCSIYIPKVQKIEGTIVAFLAQPTIDQFVNGEASCDSIVIFATTKNELYVGKQEAKNIIEDAQNIAKAFGADPGNLSVCGFSQGGSLAGGLVENSEPGTFTTAIFASTRYGREGVTDPDVKVITLVGSRETENGDTARLVHDEFITTHQNETEIYTIAEENGMDAHMMVMPQALASDQFGGKNIFDYVASLGAKKEEPIITPIVPTTPTPPVVTTPTPGVTAPPTTTPGATSTPTTGPTTTPSPTLTPKPTAPPTATPGATSTPTTGPTTTPSPTATPTAPPTTTPGATSTPTVKPTVTTGPTATPKPSPNPKTPSPTAAPVTPTPNPTQTPKPDPSPVGGPTTSPSPTATPTTETKSAWSSPMDEYNELRQEMFELKKIKKPAVIEEPVTEEPVVEDPVKTDPVKTDPVKADPKPPVADPDPKPDPKPPVADPDPKPPTPPVNPEPTYILPENKFSEIIPNISGGTLDSMEISISNVNYELSGITDEIYNNYINSIKEAGFALGTDGIWISGNYTLNLVRNNTDLNIYFKSN